MKEIVQGQKKIILKFKKYFQKKSQLNSYNYCSLGSDSLGALKFKLSINFKKYFFSFLKEFIKELYSLGLIENIKIIKNCNSDRYENIILNWSFKSDFKKSFYDKYFNINSDNYKKILWLLVYMSNDYPNKLPQNTCIMHIKKNTDFRLNCFFKNIFFIMNNSKLPLRSIIFNFSQQLLISIHLNKIFTDNINFSKIKKFLLPYESQLFQKEIIHEIKKKQTNVKIIGYDHTAPQPMPINLFYDRFSPDLLLVGSKNKLKFNNVYLGWPKNKIKLMKSFRFKTNKDEFRKSILLPYALKNEKKHLKNMRILMEIMNIKTLSKFKIKIHPACQKKSDHLKFCNKIKNLKNFKYKKHLKKIDVNNVAIFFGQTTAIPLAIESGLNCYNICDDSKFDVYNSEFWKGIISIKINNYIFHYKIKNKDSLIWIDNKTNDFRKILKI